MTSVDLTSCLGVEVGNRAIELEDLNAEREQLCDRLRVIEDRIQTLEYEISRIKSAIKVLNNEY